MAARSRRSWLSVLLGLVLGFLLASRLILPRAAEIHRYSRRGGGGLRGGGQAGGGCGVPAGSRSDRHDLLLPYIGSRSPGGEETGDSDRDRRFLYVGVMTAQKYLQTRAVAAYR